MAAWATSPSRPREAADVWCWLDAVRERPPGPAEILVRYGIRSGRPEGLLLCVIFSALDDDDATEPHRATGDAAGALG